MFIYLMCKDVRKGKTPISLLRRKDSFSEFAIVYRYKEVILKKKFTLQRGIREFQRPQKLHEVIQHKKENQRELEEFRNQQDS
ncbi:hypothetical protein TNIN_462141 [Trichonephila inaurata madagascariensis]|uniref:Uncharacterized protein n=1 Tax=Trichonephila inaurata madagascariensis TaxID=2747483 RepID=A0A8X6WMM2_9ARAC|nr:hypothetical protein TNIN_462141 [Trichonephila inaurata madagascariensis]